VAEELKRQGWGEEDLVCRRRNDPVKLDLAARLRRETTMTLKWMAQRLRWAVGTTYRTCWPPGAKAACEPENCKK